MVVYSDILQSPADAFGFFLIYTVACMTPRPVMKFINFF